MQKYVKSQENTFFLENALGTDYFVLLISQYSKFNRIILWKLNESHILHNVNGRIDRRKNGMSGANQSKHNDGSNSQRRWVNGIEFIQSKSLKYQIMCNRLFDAMIVIEVNQNVIYSKIECAQGNWNGSTYHVLIYMIPSKFSLIRLFDCISDQIAMFYVIFDFLPWR